jgi:hypothetical protein
MALPTPRAIAFSFSMTNVVHQIRACSKENGNFITLRLGLNICSMGRIHSFLSPYSLQARKAAHFHTDILNHCCFVWSLFSELLNLE